MAMEDFTLSRVGHFQNGVYQSRGGNDDEVRTGYKLFRRDKNAGTLHPLFLDHSEAVPTGSFLPAKDMSAQASGAVPGAKMKVKPRPGWHASEHPYAPHLMDANGNMPKDRVWAQVSMPAHDSVEYKRPEAQGGKWMLGGRMRVDRVLDPAEHEDFQQKSRDVKADQARRRAAKRAPKRSET